MRIGSPTPLPFLHKFGAHLRALLAREQFIFERYTRSLAQLIARERGMGAEDPEPWVIANALLGLHRALIDYVRRRVLADEDTRRVARGVRAYGEHALALLEHRLDQESLDAGAGITADEPASH